MVTLMIFVPYIMFEGNAEEALNFYGDILGKSKEPYIMRYTDMQGMEIPDDYKNKILHAELNFPGGTIYISDAFPGTTVTYNESIAFNIGPDTEEELNRLYNALLEDGTEVQPLADTFWGAKFGSINDKFGLHWSFNYTLPKA